MAKARYKNSSDLKVPLSSSVKTEHKEILSKISKAQGTSIGRLAGMIIEDKLNQIQKEGKLDDLDNLRLADLFDLERLI